MDTNPPPQNPGISRLLDDHRTCPCGAHAESRPGRCRKCQARAAWRRRHQRPIRLTRRAAARARRRVARLVALALAISLRAAFPPAQTTAGSASLGPAVPGGEH